MTAKKDSKLIREIKEIIGNPDLHFWIKCKQLVKIKIHNRPSSYEGAELIRKFFKTCAGKYKDRFETAYVRPYCDNWNDRSAYDHVKNAYLNEDPSAKIGRNPRGIKFVPTHEHVRRAYESSVRFSRYLKRKYPEAFETFEEIKKVQHHYGPAMEETEDCAWQHIFPRVRKRDPLLEGETSRGQTTKEAQVKRRKLDFAMEKAQAGYKKLKKVSKLPPRYLYNEVSLADLQNDHKNHTYTIFKKHYITTETVLHYDNSEVHHGLGHLKQTDRKILIRNGKGIIFSKTLKAYSGNFVLNAVEEYFGKVEKVQVFKSLKAVQLNPKMKVVETWEFDIQNFRIFERLFAGTFYDYCVLRDGITYHGASMKLCVAGWKKKKALSKVGAKIINMKFLRGLGFCPAGVRSFCASNGLDSHEDYTVEELKTVVRKNLSYNRLYYDHELRQLGVL